MIQLLPHDIQIFLLLLVCRTAVVQQYIIGGIGNGDRGFQLMRHIIGEICFKFFHRL